jgi:hypothetical protein
MSRKATRTGVTIAVWTKTEKTKICQANFLYEFGCNKKGWFLSSSFSSSSS